MKNQLKLFACVIRQYGTGIYRACVSLDRGRLICLGAWPNESAAFETMNRFQEAQRKGEVETADDIAAFIAAMQAA
ncbi:MAG: hypothetical protein ACKVX9_00640 [Blastocatellia bacterium]